MEEAQHGKQPQQSQQPSRPQHALPSLRPGRLPSSCIPFKLKVGTQAPQARCLRFVKSGLNKAFKTIILSHQSDSCRLASSFWHTRDFFKDEMGEKNNPSTKQEYLKKHTDFAIMLWPFWYHPPKKKETLEEPVFSSPWHTAAVQKMSRGTWQVVATRQTP